MHIFEPDIMCVLHQCFQYTQTNIDKHVGQKLMVEAEDLSSQMVIILLFHDS